MMEVFRNLSLEGTLPDPERRTIVSPAVVQDLANRVGSPLVPLFDPADRLTLPSHVYGLGPIWLERWDDVSFEERFQIPVHGGEQKRKIDELRKRLIVISNERALPDTLRRAARDLHAMLDRPEALDGRSFSTGREVESRRGWVCLPLDYVRFCRDDANGEARQLSSEAQELWLDGLYRTFAASATPTAAHPVIPAFRDRPFLVALTMGDPTGLAHVFDSRYFMALAELNLLNTILFVRNCGDA